MFPPRDPNGPPEPEFDPEATFSGSYDFALPPAVDRSYALGVAMTLAGNMIRLERESSGRFKIARTVSEVRENFGAETLAGIMHLEGADAIDTDLATLEVLYQAGLRSLGVVWSRPNAFGHGVPFRFPSSPDTGPGLTDAGKALVTACNEMGVMIDLSHLTEQGFWDVAGISARPLVATHSCVHALSPCARNLTDKQLDAIKETGGVMGLNFHVSFLRDDGRLEVDTPIDTLVRHIVYVADRLGVNHVALGSDFDGATMPNSLPDVAALPQLITALREHGFDECDLEKIAHGNWFRILEETL